MYGHQHPPHGPYGSPPGYPPAPYGWAEPPRRRRLNGKGITVVLLLLALLAIHGTDPDSTAALEAIEQGRIPSRGEIVDHVERVREIESGAAKAH